MLLNTKGKIAGYLFILPAFVLYTVFFFYPIVVAFVYSFYDWDGVSEKVFAGWENYRYIFQNATFIRSIVNTFVIMLSSVFVQIPLALFLSVLLNTEFPGFRLFRTLYFVPVVISTVVIGIMWSLFLHPYIGLLNTVLRAVGLGSLIQNWLGDPAAALVTVNVVNVWAWFGYLTVIIMAGLKGIPRSIVEAAMIDGVNAWQKFVYITWPMLKWTIQVCVLLAVTGSLKIFDLIFVMTGGGPGDATEVMATYMWRISFISTKFGAGSAVAAVILGISLVLTVLQRLAVSED